MPRQAVAPQSTMTSTVPPQIVTQAINTTISESSVTSASVDVDDLGNLSDLTNLLADAFVPDSAAPMESAIWASDSDPSYELGNTPVNDRISREVSGNQPSVHGRSSYRSSCTSRWDRQDF